MEPLCDDVGSTRSRATARSVPVPPRVRWHWPVGCVLAVTYASLIPFDFSLENFHLLISNGLLSVPFRPTTPDDAAANLLVYLVVGLVVGLSAMRSRCARWTAAILALAIGTSLSILVETLQAVLVSRVASCTDILLNCVGAAIGGCLGVGLSGSVGVAMTQGRRELADRPFNTAASLLTLGLFLYNLVPFDFVTTTDALHASFGRAHWGLMNARDSAVAAPPLSAIAHQLTGTGWFAVLGYLLALAGRERGRDSATSLGSALKDGLMLVVLVEFMQLFTLSHTLDVATVLIRGFGVAFGAWCAVFIIDSLTGSAWRRKPSLALPTGIVAILAAFQFGLLIAPCLNLQNGLLLAKHDWTVQWLPFENLQRQPYLTAEAELLSVLLTYGTLALTFQILLHRLRNVRSPWLTLGAVTLAATTCAGVSLLIAGKPVNVTTILLAWFAALLVGRAWNSACAQGRVLSAPRGKPLSSLNPWE